jgi:hypothetical protein
MPKIKLTIEHGLAVTPLVEGEPTGTLRGRSNPAAYVGWRAGLQAFSHHPRHRPRGKQQHGARPPGAAQGSAGACGEHPAERGDGLGACFRRPNWHKTVSKPLSAIGIGKLEFDLLARSKLFACDFEHDLSRLGLCQLAIDYVAGALGEGRPDAGVRVYPKIYAARIE